MEIAKNFKNRQLSPGFTLIEILVALATLGIVLVVVVSTFLTVLTKSAKVKVVAAVESDGKYALRIIERVIRGAREIIVNSGGQTCQADMNYLRIKDPDGEWIEFGCFNETTEAGYVPSLESYLTFSSATYDRRLTSPQVTLDRCQFNCFSGGFEEPNRVEIYFSLSQAASTSKVEEQASIDFQTMVTLRNY